MTPYELESKLALEKICKERQAAVRALSTNFCIVFLFCLPNMFMLINSPWAKYLCTLNMSVHKGLMPILTTIANFGTVRDVSSEYWNVFKEKLFRTSIRSSG